MEDKESLEEKPAGGSGGLGVEARNDDADNPSVANDGGDRSGAVAMKVQATEDDLQRKKGRSFYQSTRSSEFVKRDETGISATSPGVEDTITGSEPVNKTDNLNDDKEDSFLMSASTVAMSEDSSASFENRDTTVPATGAPSGVEALPVYRGDEAVQGRPGAYPMRGGRVPMLPDASGEDFSEADIEQGELLARVVNDDDLRAEMERETEEEVRRRILDEAVAATSVSTEERRMESWKVVIFLVGILSIAIALILVIAMSNNTSGTSALPPEATEEESNVESGLRKEPFLLQLLSLVSSEGLLLNKSTHQFQALQWMLINDTTTTALIFDGLDEAPTRETLVSTDPVLESYTNNNLLVERYVAALLYFATGGPEFWLEQHDFLNPNTSVCDWPPPVDDESDDAYGIRCNKDGRITKIHFRFNAWYGTIPRELSAISNLEILDMAGMKLSGDLPSEIGLLTRLERLVLAHNQLTSTIPTSLEQLTNLQWIYLFANSFTGTIPRQLTQISPMTEFLLDNCLLTGVIPEFREENAMKRIQLQGNMFSGTVPTSVASLGSLEQLWFRGNMLTGSIPSSFGKLEKLKYFDACDNMLSGTLSSDMADTMIDVLEISLRNNRLSGQIPDLDTMERLAVLDVSYNRFTGSFPILPRSVVVINLSFNPISGSVPASLSTYPNLFGGEGSLSITNMNLTGSLDPIFCNRTEGLLPPMELEADCMVSPSTGRAELECSCCTTCCDDATGECHLDLNVLCQGRLGQLGLERAEPTCACSDGGTSMACSDRNCESCSEDESICAYPSSFGMSSPPELVVDGTDDEESLEELHRYWHCDMQYVKGRNELVRLEYDKMEQTCSVSVNGTECHNCNPMSCSSGLETWRIDCTNVEQSSFFYPCDPSSSSGGALLAAFSAPFMDSDCAPCWHGL